MSLLNLRKQFLSLPQNALMKIYKARCERLRMLMHKGIPRDICWKIEAKVYLTSKSLDLFISYMPNLGKSSYKNEKKKIASFITKVHGGPVINNIVL